MRRHTERIMDGTHIAIWAHVVASQATFLVLMFEDWPRLTWWNWIIIVPVNQFLSQIWPIYWPILRPLLG